MRALLDEQVPAELADLISGLSPHEVSTVGAMGWKGLKNGLLLRQMREAGFAVLITIDRRMEYQQNIPRSGVGLIVLHAFRARLAELSPLTPEIATALDRIGPGEIIHLRAQPPNRSSSSSTLNGPGGGTNVAAYIDPASAGRNAGAPRRIGPDP